MTRTHPNRLAAHAATIPPVAYPNAIAGAVSFLHAQLRNPDMDIAMTAALALLDLEKTRMRHGAPIAGTEPPHRAAGLPAGNTRAETQKAESSPANLSDAVRPAGKPAAICGTQIPASSSADLAPTDVMSFDEIMADPEMRDGIRQTRCKLERADPGAVHTVESVGRMIYAQMPEFRSRGG